MEDQEQMMSSSSCVPPGFRFHPTEEELVGYYLARKVASKKIAVDVIADVDLYRIEPWDIKQKCKQGRSSSVTGGEVDEDGRAGWYFFSRRDRKHSGGIRTNRATAAGFWKATGRDKAVLSSTAARVVIGMRKTLVFYVGRAPNGRRTNWIMHEYRLLHQQHSNNMQEEAGWVVCRAFKKQVPGTSASQRRPCSFVPYDDNQEQLRGASSSSEQTLVDPCSLMKYNLQLPSSSSTSTSLPPLMAASSSSRHSTLDDHWCYLEPDNHSSSLFLDIPRLLDDNAGWQSRNWLSEIEEELQLLQAPTSKLEYSLYGDGVICKEAVCLPSWLA